MFYRWSRLFVWVVGLTLFVFGLIGPGCNCGVGPSGEGDAGVEQPSSGGDRVGSEDPNDSTKEPPADGTSEPLEPSKEAGPSDASEPSSENTQDSSETTGEGRVEKEADNSEQVVEKDPPGPRFSFTVKTPVEDTVPPKLLNVTFQPTSVKAGEWVKVTITVGPDLSEVTSAQITLSGPNDKHSLYVDTTYHPSQKSFQAVVRIPERSEAGVWYAQRLTLQDGARIPSVYTSQQAPLKGTTFTVSSTNPDVTPPALTKITLDSQQVKVKESLGFTLEASDTGVGLSDMEVEIRPDTGGGRLTSKVLYDPVKKVFVGRFRFPAGAPTGKWKVTRVDLSDSIGNRGSLSATDALLKPLTFDVLANGTPPKADTQPPELTAAWLEPSVVNAGEPVRVFVSAKDNLSGIQYARVTYVNPVGQIRFQHDLRFNSSTGLWEGNGNVPPFSRNGLWRLRSIQLTDFSGNVNTIEKDDLYVKTPYLTKQSLNNRLDHLAFQVNEGANVDRKSPVMKGVNLAPGTVKAGESIRVYARIDDQAGSGVSSASCTFTGPFGRATQQQVVLSLNSDTGFFEGTLSFSASAPAGDWWMSGCFMQDKTGNTQPIAGWALTKLPPLDISRATSKASKDPFVVKVQTSGQTPTTDTTPPVMKSFHFAPGLYVSLGMARFFVKVEDINGSGVSSGSCRFVAADGIGLGFNSITSMSAFLRYNPATGYWESQFNVPREAVRGDWWIDSCNWTDNAGNTASFNAPQLAAMPALSLAHINISPAPDHRVFKIVPGTNPDIKPPVATAVNLFPKKVDAGDSLRFYLKATDDQEITVTFCSLKPSMMEPPFSPYGSARMRFNPGNILYEGNFRLSPLARTGWWSIAGCQVIDRRGNRWDQKADGIRKLAKQDISGIVSATLNKSTTIPVVNSSQQDTDAPTASQVKWLPSTQVNAGNAAVLEVVASDKGLGLLRVEARIKSPSGKQQLFANLPYNVATKKWEGVVNFPTDAETGKWIVSRVDVYDLAGNIKNYLEKDTLLKLTQIQVVGGVPQKDQKSPEIKSLKGSKSVVLAGESVRWSASITDDLSGVDGATIQLVSPKKGLIASGQLQWNPATGLWEGETVLPKDGEDGAWKVSTLSARDKAGRFTSIDSSHALLTGKAVTVRNTTPQVDTEAPTIKNISILPKTINVGQSFQVVADVSDNRSGVSNVTVQIESEKKLRLFYLRLEFNPATLKYEGTQFVGLDAPGGTWEITSITLSDKAGNTRFIQKGSPFLP